MEITMNVNIINKKDMKKKLAYIGLASLFLSFTACESSDNEFSDFDYQTVYFANQYGVRTIELGEEEFVDNSLDNEHKMVIKATWAGGYTNRKNVVIDTKVDESLCANLYFKGTDTPVTPMPTSYYTMASNQIRIPKGEILGGIEVQLTDAFFADEKSLDTYYVIPVVMTDVQGADSILQGKNAVEAPVLTNSGDWSIQPKNFVLYGVKYVNPWHGEYLRRGVDQAVINGVPSQLVRHQQYVEKDEKVNISTSGMSGNILALSARDSDGNLFNYNLTLTFDADGNSTVGSTSDDFAVSGTGKFVKKGEKNSLGGKDRDALYLDYTIDFKNKNMQYATKDTLVLSSRAVYGSATFEVDIR